MVKFGINACESTDQNEGKLSPALGPLGFGERRLDRFFGPLDPGKVTFLEATTPFVFDLVYLMVVNALRSPDAQVVYVDGCNRINPYEIVHLCKRYRMDPGHALDRLHICRGFTAYQLSAIIEEQLEEHSKDARLIIVSGMQELYRDKDVYHKEAEILVERASYHVSSLVNRVGAVGLITDIAGPQGKDLRFRMLGACYRHLRLTRLTRRLRLHDMDHEITLDYLPVPLQQMVLDDFWDVI